MSKRKSVSLIILISILASLITVASQFEYIRARYGNEYIPVENYNRHRDVVSGTALAPFRFRILSAGIVEAGMQTAKVLGVENLDFHSMGRHISLSRFELVSISVRLIQNFFIFLFAFWYFKTLKFSVVQNFICISLTVYGMCFAFFNTDLGFYTYSELLLFLAAAVCVNLSLDRWVVLLTALAAMNRESAFLMPFLLLAKNIEWKEKLQIKVQWKSLGTFGVGLIAFFLVFVLVRLVIGSAPYVGSGYGNVYPGLQLFFLNLKYHRTWFGLVQMFTILPLTLIFINRWTSLLKSDLLVLVLPWFVLHFTFGTASETRLFLVPLILVFIPAVINLLQFEKENSFSV